MKDTKKNQLEKHARTRSAIELVEGALARFNQNLSDDRKIRLFTMNHAALKKLADDLTSTETGMKAISVIVAAIAASDEERRQDADRSV